MKDLLDRVLKAGSQQALGRSGEKVDEFREEAAPALATLKETLEGATAVLALPEKYTRWLRTKTC